MTVHLSLDSAQSLVECKAYVGAHCDELLTGAFDFDRLQQRIVQLLFLGKPLIGDVKDDPACAPFTFCEPGTGSGSARPEVFDQLSRVITESEKSQTFGWKVLNAEQQRLVSEDLHSYDLSRLSDLASAFINLLSALGQNVPSAPLAAQTPAVSTAAAPPPPATEPGSAAPKSASVSVRQFYLRLPSAPRPGLPAPPRLNLAEKTFDLQVAFACALARYICVKYSRGECEFAKYPLAFKASLPAYVDRRGGLPPPDIMALSEAQQRATGVQELALKSRLKNLCGDLASPHRALLLLEQAVRAMIESRSM